MASTGKTSNRVKRRSRGFTRADSLVQPQVRNVGEGRGFAVSRLLTQWREIAGTDIASMTQPLRVSYGRGGLGATLTLLVRGAGAPLVQAQLPRLREKVNACYGYNAIARITITQTAPTGFAEQAAPFHAAPAKRATPAVSEQAVSQLNVQTEDIADPDLRAALSGLGRNIVTRQKIEE